MGGGLILHYANGRWSIVPKLPTGDYLSSIAMVSASEGWAVGWGGTILHYANGRWSIVPRLPTGYYLYSIAMVSASEGWAVGVGTANGSNILHYAGGQ